MNSTMSLFMHSADKTKAVPPSRFFGQVVSREGEK